MSEDPRPYFEYTVKVRGKEKWKFGTTEDIKIKDIKVEKELIRSAKV